MARPSTVAWAVLIGGVLIYSALAPKDEKMSHAVDRGLETKYRPLILGGIIMTALHLGNLIPSKYDPFTIIAKKYSELTGFSR